MQSNCASSWSFTQSVCCCYVKVFDRHSGGSQFQILRDNWLCWYFGLILRLQQWIYDGTLLTNHDHILVRDLLYKI